MMENNRGITLISLTIMIVVLLILATIGINYNSNSVNYAKLTKLITEFEIINTQISILNQNKSYETEYTNYGLDATADAELISQIDTLLEEKLANVYNIAETSIDLYKTRFQYCSAENISEKLGIEGIDGNFVVNIQNKITISFDGINYNKKMYYTLEELEQDGLATNTYKVEYYGYENPYMLNGYYYVGGSWNSGYVISDSIDDKNNGNQVREITTEIVDQYRGNLYMWIPIEEKSDTNENGVNWSTVISDTDYTNIKTALDTYKTTYEIPEYLKGWYTADDAQYAYKNTEGRLVKYPTTSPTIEDTNNILSSIFSNGGLYLKIHTGEDVEIEIETDTEIDTETLPSQYQQLEYIESTGTQYIDTEFIPNSNTSVEIQLKLESLFSDTNSNNGIFGTRTDATSNSFSLICGGNDLLYSGYGSTNTATSLQLSKNVLYTIKKDKNNTIVNNTTITTANSESFTSPFALVLFAVRNGSISPVFKSNMKLYYCKIYDNDKLVRDLIPCYRKSDNVVGMYDAVNNVFYTNKGTGNFLKGPHADGTTEIEYIQSTDTQYIDTEFIPNSNTTIEMKASTSSTLNTCLYCARTGTSNKTYSAFLMNGTSLRVDYNNTQYSSVMTATKDTAYIYKQNKNLIYIDGKLAKTLPEEEFETAYNMYLLASHVAGAGADNIRNIKLYYCKIWDGDTLERDYIPVLDKNGVACLYDKVEGKYYYNKGTGAFSYE